MRAVGKSTNVGTSNAKQMKVGKKEIEEELVKDKNLKCFQMLQKQKRFQRCSKPATDLGRYIQYRRTAEEPNSLCCC